MSECANSSRVKQVLAAVKPLAIEYYTLTGKPLGVTGEIAEYVAADVLGLELVAARTEGYDAIRVRSDRKERIQIKGRVCGKKPKPGQRLGTIKPGAPCDYYLLVLLDVATLEPREIWEATSIEIEKRLLEPGSRARARGALRLNEFKNRAKRIWPPQGVSPQLE